MIKRFMNKIKILNTLINNSENERRIIINTYCNSLIKNIDNSYYLPFTSSTIDSFALAYIFNDITINGRKNILEFGSGISTILIARFIKKFVPNLKLTSIEEDKDWLSFVKFNLDRENITEYVNLIYAPLKDNRDALNNNQWYDENIIKENMQQEKFDMVIIDGPQAHLRNNALIRYPALPFVKPLLSNNAVVFLHDANRPGEDKIVHNYSNKLGYNFLIKNNLAIHYQGNYFNSFPI